MTTLHTRLEIRPALDSEARAGQHRLALDVPYEKAAALGRSVVEAARQLIAEGLRPAALNFANGIRPGGCFLRGSRAQEEVLCRSSALYSTLLGDPMYPHHAARHLPDSTDWVIVSPAVPVFRTDAGEWLDAPWPLDILTCAAPYAPTPLRRCCQWLPSVKRQPLRFVVDAAAYLHCGPRI